ncbi:MAG: methyltransferase domain-containing protein [Planctomycetes bacterium]|nr:methyltransferase domain-containing protein [Planctomycetota bacterium]
MVITMDPKAMEPHGLALLAYFEGDAAAELIIRRDDGQESSLPAGYFFREPAEFTSIEKTALARCKGHVLDVGAGSGLHSLVLQKNRLRVTAIDISPGAVEVMVRQGVQDVHGADIFEYEGGPFDTVLMLGHGIGIVEDLPGLDRFLTRARRLVSEEGLVLLDSLDVRVTDDPANLAYQEANRRAGRYLGEIRLQFEHGGKRGPCCGWLHVDANTLKERAGKAGWRCDLLVEEQGGNYLAMLARARRR